MTRRRFVKKNTERVRKGPGVIAKTIDFRFNEPKHELKAGHRVAGRPYFIAAQNLAAGDSYFITRERLNTFVIIFPSNSTHVKGTLTVSVNGDHTLYSGLVEALEAKMTEPVNVQPAIEAGNHLAVIIDCKETSGTEFYIVQLQLS